MAPVDIIATNNSWIHSPFLQAVFDAIAAHQAAGILFVAAAGNAGADNDDSTAWVSRARAICFKHMK